MGSLLRTVRLVLLVSLAAAAAGCGPHDARQVVTIWHQSRPNEREFLADEIARALEADTAAAIDRELRAIGYAHVTVDLRGYRLGSLNDALRLREV